MKKFIKFLYYYLRYHKQINEYCNYAMKQGYGWEDFTWYDRTVFWYWAE